MLLSFMELLEQEKTAHPQEQGPKDDLLDHREDTRRNNRAKTAPTTQTPFAKG
jgi:hypothetical protein